MLFESRLDSLECIYNRESGSKFSWFTILQYSIKTQWKIVQLPMKGINTSWQALDSGGVASFSTPRDGVSHLAFPPLDRE
ncbi:hypothetical protein DYP60_05750 [Sphaerochaeta halotolerans]|uniref:Uncharacterized protein n=1 Tax=Sphaerochaeta halotolerans TaxID=2293840 RepID=A0A372MH73_9SPIR|nr:hypothetical protein DYP60_05750 [Sphaerochaeta halotolerans]